MLTLTAFAVLGFTIPDPAVPCTAKRPPDDDDFEEVTVYRGFNKNSSNPGSFRFNPTLSTYEQLVPGNYEFVVPFRIRYRKPKTPQITTGDVISPIPGMKATYTPFDGDPAIGTGHWDLSPTIGGPQAIEGLQKAISEIAKGIKSGK